MAGAKSKRKRAAREADVLKKFGLHCPDIPSLALPKFLIVLADHHRRQEEIDSAKIRRRLKLHEKRVASLAITKAVGARAIKPNAAKNIEAGAHAFIEHRPRPLPEEFQQGHQQYQAKCCATKIVQNGGTRTELPSFFRLAESELLAKNREHLTKKRDAPLSPARPLTPWKLALKVLIPKLRVPGVGKRKIEEYLARFKLGRLFKSTRLSVEIERLNRQGFQNKLLGILRSEKPAGFDAKLEAKLQAALGNAKFGAPRNGKSILSSWQN